MLLAPPARGDPDADHIEDEEKSVLVESRKWPNKPLTILGKILIVGLR